MKYLKIEKCSINNGYGIRCVIWCSGCSHRCKGCHNQETWNYNIGTEFTQDDVDWVLDYLSNDYVDGVTFSGGDPLEDCNIEAFTNLAKQIKDKFGDSKSIWVYTGYTYEEVKDKDIFNFIDVLVDGQFELDKRDITLAFRGSSNQRIIDVKKGCSI